MNEREEQDKKDEKLATKWYNEENVKFDKGERKGLPGAEEGFITGLKKGREESYNNEVKKQLDDIFGDMSFVKDFVNREWQEKVCDLKRYSKDRRTLRREKPIMFAKWLIYKNEKFGTKYKYAGVPKGPYFEWLIDRILSPVEAKGRSSGKLNDSLCGISEEYCGCDQLDSNEKKRRKMESVKRIFGALKDLSLDELKKFEEAIKRKPAEISEASIHKNRGESNLTLDSSENVEGKG